MPLGLVSGFFCTALVWHEADPGARASDFTAPVCDFQYCVLAPGSARANDKTLKAA